ncbi:immunoglobulin J chain-like [Mustelus asterias]
MMKIKHMLGPLATVLLFTALVAVDPNSHLLVSSKCKLLEVKSRMVVTEYPTGARVEHVARDIKIIVPLRTRENISDPTSPIRTKFVYRISDFCKNCSPKASSQVPQCNPKPPPVDECYAHDNKTCLDYQNRSRSLVLQHLSHVHGQVDLKPTLAPVKTTKDLSSISDAP